MAKYITFLLAVMVCLVSCGTTDFQKMRELDKTPGKFQKTSFETLVRSSHGTVASVRGVLICEKKLGYVRLSIEFTISRDADLGVLSGSCIVGSGDIEIPMDFWWRWHSNKKAVFRRRDWVDLAGESPSFGYFDTGRAMWISAPDGDSETGYSEEKTIESVPFDYQQQLEVFVPAKIVDRVRNGDEFWMRFSDGSDVLEFHPSKDVLSVAKDFLAGK